MKKINLTLTITATAFVLAALLFVSCGLKENSPAAAPSLSFTKPVTTDAIDQAMVRSGLMWDRRNTADVPVGVDSALLVISWPLRMQASCSAVLKRVSDNSVVAVSASWDINTGYSTVTIRPVAALEVSKRYYVCVSASSIVDADNHRLDLDNDGVGGEAVDDDFEFYFTTYDNTGAAGAPTDVAVYSRDDQEPGISGPLFSYKNNAQSTVNGADVDATFYLRLTDTKLLLDRSGYDVPGAYEGDITGKIWMVKDETSQVIPCTILKGSDPDTAYNNQTIAGSTVSIKPASNLEPGKSYRVIVMENRIADAAGNKMDTDDGPGGDPREFTITTANSLLGGGTVRTDVTAPSFVFSAGAMTLRFDELVNEATLNAGTIWYRDDNNVVRPFVLSVVTEYDNTGKPLTVVRLTPDANNPNGDLFVKEEAICDVVGNCGSGIDSTESF